MTSASATPSPGLGRAVVLLLAVGFQAWLAPPLSAQEEDSRHRSRMGIGLEEDDLTFTAVPQEEDHRHRLRWGIGLEGLFHWQDDLTFTSLDTVVTSPEGKRDEIPGDTELTDRKFDPEWKQTGIAARFDVALPRFRLFGSPAIEPSLLLELGATELEVDFHERTEPEASAALEGDAPLLGLGFELEAPLCRDCGWFVGGGFRFRLVPETTVDRRSPISPTHLTVTEDRVRLRQEEQRVGLSVGRSFAGGRFAPYAGLRAGSTELDIEDRLRIADDRGDRGSPGTRIDTTTRLEREAIRGVAGIEGRLDRLRGRAEAAFGDGGHTFLLAAVYSFGGARSEDPASGVDAPPARSREWWSRLAARLVPELERMREELVEARTELPLEHAPSGALVYPLADLLRLLDRTESDLLAVLAEPEAELAALRDWVRGRFEDFRSELRAAAVPAATASSGRSRPEGTRSASRHPLARAAGFSLRAVAARTAHPAPHAAALPLPVTQRRAAPAPTGSPHGSVAVAQGPPPQARAVPRVPAERIFGRVLDLLERLLTLAEEDDLTVDLCVRSSPGGASVTLRPRSYPPGEEKVRRTAQRISRLPRGAYVFRVEVPEGPLRRRGYRGVDCYPRDDEPPSHCLDLDLVTRRAPLVHCDLVTRGLHGDCAVEEEPPGGTECGRD